MTPERWQQIKELLYQAQQLAPEERAAFLDHSCSSDRALRHEVETLLGSTDARSSFLENSPVSVTLLPGTKLGDYEVLKLLGSGGMGEVYRARDPRLRRDVAIKVLPAFLSSDKERLRRFEQEAQATAALNHPNILAVFQMGTYEGAPYLVSELLEGETLRSQIQRGPLLARKAIDYGVQIAHGLAAAHEKGIVHRDLKPENLFATRDGHIKILDFGLAKLKQPKLNHSLSAPTVDADPTEPGMVMGTAGYMSPEQVRGKQIDHRTDIFSFGAVLYELLTGRRAFQKTTSADTMSAILNEEPVPLSQIVTNIPPALQRTVHRCLEKSLEQRFQSASDLAFALEALSDSAASSSALRLEPAAKHSWRVGLLAIALLLLTVGAVIWWRVPAAVPIVQGVRQLTDDAEPKLMPGGNSTGNALVTDGPRIYFAEGSINSCRVSQVSVTGGQTSLVPMRFKSATVIDDIVPDLSALLVNPANDPKAWIQPLPAGEPRSLNLGINGARFLADGRIVIADAEGNSLSLANGDGSDRKKLVDVPGYVVGPSVSPDGQRIRFTVVDDRLLFSIWEVHTDGTALHQIPLKGVPATAGEVAGVWTRDGKYFLFQAEHDGKWDLWALPDSNGLLQRSGAPVQLTNGPLSYESPIGSRDGKQIFAVGSKKRGELIRYDAKSQQFVPYLDGISAVETRVSPNGKWVLYVSYPDRTLWRSRSDGSERVQLTFAPMIVLFPAISPDGTRIAFSGLTASGLGIYVLNMDGGTPERVADFGHGPTWSPDGNSLAYSALAPGAHYWSKGHWLDIDILDLRTKHISVIASQPPRWDLWWPQPNKLVTTLSDQPDSPAVFDLTTQKWSKLGEQFAVDDWVPSSDGQYLYLFTGWPEAKVRRVRASDLQIETVADIKGVRLVSDDTLSPASSGEFFGLAPDGSLTFTRDLGSDEIYALDVTWP
jgi:eukaryotic-like serine/threonine-protein kinase